MKKNLLNTLLLLLIACVLLITAALLLLKMKDDRETRALFRTELALFDKKAGTTDRALLKRSLRSLYVAADTADSWLMLMKRAHLLGDMTGDYALYLEVARKAVQDFPKNPYIHTLYIDSLVKNALYQEALSGADTAVILDGYTGLLTEAYAMVSRDIRQSFTLELPQKELMDNPTEELLLQGLDEFEDSRFILNVSILRAEEGRLSDAMTDVPYRVTIQYPEAYAVLAYDAGDYSRSLSLISEIKRKFGVIPIEMRHMSYDAMFLQGNYSQAYEGYSLLAGLEKDWRPGLNILLSKGADSHLDILKSLQNNFSHIYAVTWFFGDMYYSKGEKKIAAEYYKNLLIQRPDIIEARIRIAEAEDGYITKGRIRQILWDIYYAEENEVDPEARENAALYLLWYALGDHDSGIISFFKGEEYVSPKMKLLLAVWEVVYGSPRECLSILDNYEGPVKWLSQYLKGTASLALQDFSASREYFESIEVNSKIINERIDFKIAEVLYYAGDYRGSQLKLEPLKNAESVHERSILLMQKIKEKI